jgi:hypothetical protein
MAGAGRTGVAQAEAHHNTRLQPLTEGTWIYSTVKQYVNRKKDQMQKYKESFLPLAHPPGQA